MNELYAAALAAYLAIHQREDVTEKLNEIYATHPSFLDQDLITLQVASIGDESW